MTYMETRTLEPPTDLPAWLGGGAGAALLAFVCRIIWRSDKHGRRVDDAEGTIDAMYKGALIEYKNLIGETRQAIEEHSRDRDEWRIERKELKDELTLCRASHQACELRIVALEKKP